ARKLGVPTNDRLRADADVARRALPQQQIVLDRLRVLVAVLEVDRLRRVEVVEKVLRRIAERPQQRRCEHLAAPVDANVDAILRIELEIEPRPAVRNDPRVVEKLPARVRLALVVVEEDARATMELRNDDAFGTIDDKG